MKDYKQKCDDHSQQSSSSYGIFQRAPDALLHGGEECLDKREKEPKLLRDV